jgi:hypothetical protein
LCRRVINAALSVRVRDQERLGTYSLASISAADCLIATSTFTSAAQGQMYVRINAAVEQRAKEHGLGKDVVTYCRIELNFHIAQVPTDGSIPFGAKHNEIKAVAELDTVIEVREALRRCFCHCPLESAGESKSGSIPGGLYYSTDGSRGCSFDVAFCNIKTEGGRSGW